MLISIPFYNTYYFQHNLQTALFIFIHLIMITTLCANTTIIPIFSNKKTEAWGLKGLGQSLITNKW